MDKNFKTFHFDSPHPSRSAELTTKPSPARGEGDLAWTPVRVNLIVAKIFSKIFFVSFNSGGKNAFSRWQLDLTFGDFCPPTLTLPLGGRREGWG
jgi:hypothetical protein